MGAQRLVCMCLSVCISILRTEDRSICPPSMEGGGFGN